MSYQLRENIQLTLPSVKDKVKEFETGNTRAGQKLLVEFAAIHVGLTSNYNFYSEEELRKSIESWTSPYPKPILKNHDPESEPIGRVVAASMDYEDGKPFIRLQAAISDPVAIEKLIDNRYLTGSVGGRAEEALCSICDADWAQRINPFEMPCEHEKGKTYKEGIAYLRMGGLGWKEYSVVNVPADGSSRVLSIGRESAESDFAPQSNIYAFDMEKGSLFMLSEAEKDIDVLSVMEPKEAHKLYASIRDAFVKPIGQEDDKAVSDSIENDQVLEDETSTDEEEDVLEAVESLQEDTEETEEGTQDQSSEGEATDESPSDEVEEEAEGDESSEDVEESDETEESSDETNEVSEDETRVTELEEQVSSLTEQVETLTSSLTEKENELEATKGNLEAATQENVRLRKAIKEGLAARVVDLKITLGISNENERKELMKEHTARAANSLADSIRDLLKLAQEKRTSTHMPKVDGIVIDGEVEDEEENEESESPEPKDFFVDVLMGRRRIN